MMVLKIIKQLYIDSLFFLDMGKCKSATRESLADDFKRMSRHHNRHPCAPSLTVGFKVHVLSMGRLWRNRDWDKV